MFGVLLKTGENKGLNHNNEHFKVVYIIRYRLLVLSVTNSFFTTLRAQSLFSRHI